MFTFVKIIWKFNRAAGIFHTQCALYSQHFYNNACSNLLLYTNYRATACNAMHGIATRMLPVYDKIKETCAHSLIPHERYSS